MEINKHPNIAKMLAYLTRRYYQYDNLVVRGGQHRLNTSAMSQAGGFILAESLNVNIMRKISDIVLTMMLLFGKLHN